MKQNACQTSLTADLNLIYATMPSGLLNDEGYERLAAVTGRLPAELTNFWGLECRLHKQAPLTDILLEIRKNSPGLKLLAGQGTDVLDELCQKYAIWKEIRSFASQWVCSQTLLNSRILNLWLEFDTEKPVSLEALPMLVGQPSVFLGFRSSELPAEELRELLRQSGKVLQIPGEFLDTIVSFIADIPSPGQLFQLGSMLGRPCRDIRVCVNKLSPRVVPGWLAHMGWRGSVEALTAALNKLSPFVRTLAVDLSLTEIGISEKIGIECYLDWDQNNPELWSGFLDMLEEVIPIQSSKRSGLLQYSGKLPMPVSRRKDTADTLSLFLFKMIHHIKLGFHKDRIEDAKAYLAIYRPGIQLNNNWLID